MKFSFSSLIMSCWVLLAACGGESTDVASPESTPPQIKAASGLTVVSGDNHYINLKDKVFSSQGEVRLVNVDSPTCARAREDEKGLGFYIDMTEHLSLCSYQYTVEADSQGRSSTASAQVTAVMASSSDFLQPLSVAMNNGQSAYPVPLPKEDSAGHDISGYQLSFNGAADIIIDGLPISVSPSIVRSAYNTLILDATVLSEVVTGYSRITYVMEAPDESDEPQVYVGTIDVAISEEGSHPPVFNSGDYSRVLTTGKTEKLDLDNSPFVEPGNRQYQLVKVESWYANVALSDPDDVTNKVFTFKAHQPGEHQVSAVIGDHYGGFDTGVINIMVKDPYTLWNDITVGTETFSAPSTQTQAIQAGLVSEPYADESYLTDTATTYYLSQVSYQEGEGYCRERGGEIPTKAQFDALYSTNPRFQKWPYGQMYWVAKEEEGGEAYDLNTGMFESSSEPHHYLTCVFEQKLYLNSQTEDKVIANGSDDAVMTINVFPPRVLTIDISANSPNPEYPQTVTTDEQGKAALISQSLIAETVTYTARYGPVFDVAQVSFKGDPQTASITVEVNKNGAMTRWFAENDHNKATITLADDNHNPIEGERVSLRADSHWVSLGNSQSLTDSTGQLVIEAVSYADAAMTSKLSASYQRPNGSLASEMSTLYFIDKPTLYNVKTISSTQSAFAAIKSDGSVITWGVIEHGGDSDSVSTQLTGGVSHVFANNLAFSALKTNGTVVTWGVGSSGGNSSSVQSKLNDVTDIRSTLSAFAALKADGSVVTWGDEETGGDSDNERENLAGGVVNIASTVGAFAALKADGRVVTWGDKYLGGDSEDVLSQLTGVVSIAATDGAFAALRDDGSVVTWGDIDFGGNSDSVASQIADQVKRIYGNNGAFAALKSNGHVVVWGNFSYGGDNRVVTDITNVSDIYATERAFAALTSAGSVYTWGSPGFGGNSTSVSNDLVNVVDIFSNDKAFVARKDDGSVIVWGDASYGGDLTSSGVDDVDGVTHISSTSSAFAALLSEGKVITWGNVAAGGNSESVAIALSEGEIVDIFSNDSSFAALKNDGSVITWGAEFEGGNSCLVQPYWLIGEGVSEGC
ncbi:hypothetical protein [Vibrio sp. qd031]|uniref:hypothetical protein n=1 Tax=Vibrio sp. qd031 TaxID=1603038 RepID=UPI000A11FCC5|nr:hypothetical protein [Vibrio sp. qd031]